MDAPKNSISLKSQELGRVFWVGAAAVVAIKTVFLIADHAPNFLMGDSAAFIGTALTKWFPPQRSWTYGFFIRWFCLPFHSMAPLMIAQALGGFVTCVALGFSLRRYFQVSPGIAACVMVACALDPLQLLYERMIIAEALGLTVLALVWTASFSYCRRPRLATLLILQVLFVALISLRLQFLLPIGTVILLLPFVGNANIGAAPAGPPKGSWLAKALIHSLVSILAMVVLHGAYRAAMGIKNRQPPAYSYGTSSMILSAFAPLVRPGDAPSQPLAAAIRNDSEYPLADRAGRNDQLWNPGGLIDRLEKVTGDPYRADAMEKAIFQKMLLRDPVGILLFGLHSYADYWDIAAMPGTLRRERDSGPFDQPFTTLLATNFHLDVHGYPRPALSKTIYGWLPPWLLLLLASPLLLTAAVFCAGTQGRRETGLLLLVSTLMLAQNTMLSDETVYRYLQPLTFAALLAIGVIIQALSKAPASPVVSSL